MPENVREELAEQVLAQLVAITQFEPGTEEATTAVKNAATLYEVALKEMKMDNEWNDISNRAEHERLLREKEVYLKEKELEEKKISRRYELGVNIAGIILPIAFYSIWMDRGFEFERKGVFTSSMFRGLANNFNRLIKLH